MVRGIGGAGDQHGLRHRVVAVVRQGQEHAVAALGERERAAPPGEHHARRAPQPVAKPVWPDGCATTSAGRPCGTSPEHQSARQVREFIDEIERRAKTKGKPTEPGTELGEWIAWARRHAARLDPLKPPLELHEERRPETGPAT